MTPTTSTGSTAGLSSLARLQQAFTDALELPADTDHERLAYRETASWDSLAHMQLIITIESAFDVMMDTDDVLALNSFPVSKEILRRHGVDI